MKKDFEKDELRAEYKLSKLRGRVRGKYSQHYNAGTNLVLLDEDVADSFPTAKEVNEALRTLMKTTQNAPRISK